MILAFAALLVALLNFSSFVASQENLAIILDSYTVSAGATVLATVSFGAPPSLTVSLNVSNSIVLLTQAWANSTFTVVVPRNYFATATIYATDGLTSVVNTSYTQYAPTAVSPANGASLNPNQTVTVSVTGVYSTYSYGATFGNGLSSFTTTLPYNVTTFPVVIPRNVVGALTLTLTQGPNANSVIYYVVSPQASWGTCNPLKLGRIVRSSKPCARF